MTEEHFLQCRGASDPRWLDRRMFTIQDDAPLCHAASMFGNWGKYVRCFSSVVEGERYCGRHGGKSVTEHKRQQAQERARESGRAAKRGVEVSLPSMPEEWQCAFGGRVVPSQDIRLSYSAYPPKPPRATVICPHCGRRAVLAWKVDGGFRISRHITPAACSYQVEVKRIKSAFRRAFSRELAWIKEVA